MFLLSDCVFLIVIVLEFLGLGIYFVIEWRKGCFLVGRVFWVGGVGWE